MVRKMLIPLALLVLAGGFALGACSDDDDDDDRATTTGVQDLDQEQVEDLLAQAEQVQQNTASVDANAALIAELQATINALEGELADVRSQLEDTGGVEEFDPAAFKALEDRVVALEEELQMAETGE